MDRGLDKVAKKLVKIMDLPADAILDLPRITMVGNTEVSIENHKGIEKYTSTETVIRFQSGQMRVYGRRLAIRFIDRDGLKLEGIIANIEFAGQQ
ncbi:MAG: sporulation protein YqfC [Firmicutes bacterium]|jgi:sporulation protein YqfC|nr:sporulation protein YqfC [Bacillota bacterium]NLL88363.1 sporulation protein YqfC [Bacillota bacterium]HKM17717.1 sporulation protein YqfC [Limnochordia bacterium]